MAAVPNNTSFSFLDVVNAVSGNPTNLVACFANATPSAFDPAFSGSKNSLLNFRNYNESGGGSGGGGGGGSIYYRLMPCGGGTAAYTLISTSLSSQRYVLPLASNTYYTWVGTTVIQTSHPSGYNGNIQILSGISNCP